MSTGVRTLRITDELDLATLPRLVRTVDRVLHEHPETLQLDLSTCPFAGVDAVDALASLTAHARQQGTELVLVGVRPIVTRVIDLLGLEQHLQYAPLPAPRPASDPAA